MQLTWFRLVGILSINLVKCVKRKIFELHQHRLHISLKVKIGGLRDHSNFKIDSLNNHYIHTISL